MAQGLLVFLGLTLNIVWLAAFVCVVVYVAITVGPVSAKAARQLDASAARIHDARYSLPRAIEEGDVATMRTLLESGARAGTRSPSGRTVLMAAAEAGDLTLVKEMLWRGANRNARDADGQTALSLAEQRGHTEVVCTLRGVPLPESADEPAASLPTPGGEPQPSGGLPLPARAASTAPGEADAHF